MKWIREDSMKVMFDCRAPIIAYAMWCLSRSKVTIEQALFEIADKYYRELGGGSSYRDDDFSQGDAMLIPVFTVILSDRWFDDHDTIQYVHLKDLTKRTRSVLKTFSSENGITPASVVRRFNSMRKWAGIQKFNTYKSMKY